MLLTYKSFKETIGFICALIYAVYLRLVRKDLNRVIIYYHGIKKEDVGQFEKQMAYLAKTCIVVTASHIKTARTDGKKSVIAITFDDAFVNILDNAIPVLTKLHLTATVFVPTGNLGKPPQWELSGNYSDKDEFVMNKQQVSKLDKDGFEIFSHSVSHPILTKIDDNELQIELEQSKKTLQEIVGHEVIGLSYPYGAYDNRVYEFVRQAGYKLGFTIEPGLIHDSTDDLKIERTSVSPNDNIIKFKLKASGAYQVLRYLSHAKHLALRLLNVQEC